jgi:hypothetical protein
MTYQVYENWVADGHKARVHRSDCAYCNFGEGIHRHAGTQNGRWSQAFATVDEALAYAKATGASKVMYCRRCSPC